jgi:circadian clock protein KaiC
VLTGSSRLSQEAREKSAALARRQEAERKNRERLRKREALEARIAALRKEFEVEEAEAEIASVEYGLQEQRIADIREVISRSRQADLVPDEVDGKRRRGDR